MIPDFDRALLNPFRAQIPWNDSYNIYLIREEVMREEWWLWKETSPPPNASRPCWWNVSNKEDAKVFTYSLTQYSYTNSCFLLIVSYADGLGHSRLH